MSLKKKSWLLKIADFSRLLPTRYTIRRSVPWRVDHPVVSFTFDDFPRSALTVGGRVLGRYGVSGTYYASCGLIGITTAAGEMFVKDDLVRLIHDGHEIGCHTYDHLDAWETPTGVFEASIQRNLASLKALCPRKTFWTFSYPRSEPRRALKAVAGRHFLGCRAGGHRINGKTIDLNLIRSCFIDSKNSKNAERLIAMIEQNAKDKRWLVFSTHDVGDAVSPYGCPKDLLEELVAKSLESGAAVLPLIEVCTRLLQ